MNPRLFGCVVSIANNIVVVGSPSVGNKGSVYVYKIIDNDIEEVSSPIIPDNGHIDDGFGISCKIFSISTSTYYLIIGSHRKYYNSISVGSVYIYKSTNYGQSWILCHELNSNNKTHNSYFGCSVDINDSIAIAGAYGDNNEGWRSGSINIFSKHKNKDLWIQTNCIRPTMLGINPDSTSSMYLGFSVSLYQNFIAVGAPSDKNVGSVFILHSKDWQNKSNYDSYTLSGDNKFGFSTSINNNKLLVGSPGENGLPGKAFIYNISSFFDTNSGFITTSQYSTNIHYNIINTKSKSSKSLFGRSVCINDKFIVVSGFGKSDDEQYVGSAFLYSHQLYKQQNDIDDIACLRDKQSTELFGHSVATNNNYVVIGDPTADKVHIYHINQLIGTYLKKWCASSICINPPQQFNLEFT